MVSMMTAFCSLLVSSMTLQSLNLKDTGHGKDNDGSSNQLIFILNTL